MIKYTTKDIVNRASQLADLENSDFISWNENINLLNENWQKIYQQLIDNGDKTFIKEMNITSKDVIKLPCDFYQLYSVEILPTCIQIPRKAKSESEKSMSYDIINDELHLYGLSIENIRIRYLPIPQTLTLKNKIKDINSNMYTDTSYKPYDCYKNKYIYAKYNEVKIYSVDSNDVIQSSTFNLNIKNAVIGKRNSYAIITDNNAVIKTFNETIDINLDSAKGCLLKCGDEVGVVKFKDNVITINISDKEYVIDIANSIRIDNGEWDFNIDSLGIGTYKEYYDGYSVLILPIVDSETSKCSYVQLDISKENENIHLTKTPIFENYDFGYTTQLDRKSYVNVIDENLCLSTKNGFYINDLLLFSYDDYSLIGVNEINKDDGYGISIIDIYESNKIMLHSAFVDTFLLYPNNVYFNFISILMAISYKIKQNGDVTLLTAKLQEMESQYFDTLSRDINNVVRITNVY